MEAVTISAAARAAIKELTDSAVREGVSPAAADALVAVAPNSVGTAVQALRAQGEPNERITAHFLALVDKSSSALVCLGAKIKLAVWQDMIAP